MKSEGGEEKKSQENRKKENMKQGKQKERFRVSASKHNHFLLLLDAGWPALGSEKSSRLDTTLLLNPVFCNPMGFNQSSGWLGSGLGNIHTAYSHYGGSKRKGGP